MIRPSYWIRYRVAKQLTGRERGLKPLSAQFEYIVSHPHAARWAEQERANH